MAKKIVFIIIFILSLAALGGAVFIHHIIHLNGESVVYLSLNDEYHESGARLDLLDEDNIKIIGEVDNTKVGDYKIKYEANVLGIKVSTSRTVKVVDREAPSIELVNGETVNVCSIEGYKEDGYKAIDNYDGDITDKVKVERQDNIIFYTVSDSSNNSVTVRRYLSPKDDEKPDLKLKGDSTYVIAYGANFQDPGYEVSDNCSTNIDVKVEGQVDTSKGGIYEITYTATDENNNTSSVKRYVKVTDHTSNKGVIYLTFDDGPTTSSTPKILEILKRKNVKATFFVINHEAGSDYLIKQEYNEGHTVALHSYTHNYQQIYTSTDAFYDDLQKISDKVERLTGEKSMITRFPGGSSNTVSRNYKKGIMSQLASEMKMKGYHYFDWNVDCGDAGGAKNSDDVYNNVVKNLSKNRSNVVLMHDFGSNTKTINALERIIDYGLANGYRFDKIDMTTPMVTHNVNN